MSEQPVLQITASFAPFDVETERSKVEAAAKEIESAGVTVTSVLFTSADASPRFFIKFSTKEPQWSVRAKLEALHYDVGSKLQPNELTFYATKRVTESKGWST